MSNMTIDLNIVCAIMKYKFGGDTNGILVITMHEHMGNYKDIHIAHVTTEALT